MSVGMQVVGKAFEDVKVLTLAYAYEGAMNRNTRQPSIEEPVDTKSRVSFLLVLRLYRLRKYFDGVFKNSYSNGSCASDFTVDV